MPSAEHESPVALAKLAPGLFAWLMASVFDVKMPDYHHARSHDTDVRVLVPRTYRADSMMLFCDPDDKPLTAVVLEVQRGWDPDKRRTWQLYVAQLEAELDVDTRVDSTFPALAEAMRALGPRRAILYYDIVLAGLPTATRARWEAFMTTTLGNEYRSDLLRELAAQHEELGQARGETRGEARAVLVVLEGRGVAVPTDIRDQILACTDPEQLETWLRRAGTATSVDDVLRR